MRRRHEDRAAESDEESAERRHWRLQLIARSRGPAAPFVGRESELATLHAAAAQALQGQPQRILLTGPTGIGKSALLTRFGRQLLQAHPQTLWLHGACQNAHPAPFQAIRGVIDSLAQLLTAGRPRLQHQRPVELALLKRAFPVLQGLPALTPPQSSIEHEAVDFPDDPVHLRAMLHHGLRALLTELALSTLVVVALDNWQWLDADSAGLLREVLREPEPPALMVIATQVTALEGEHLVARPVPTPATQLAQLFTALPVTQLPAAQAEALADQLLVDATPAQRAWVDTQLSATHGHPQQLALLCNFALKQKEPPTTIEQLDACALVRYEVAGQSGAARVLLSILLAAAQPIPLELLLRAAAQDATTAALSLSQLSDRALIQKDGERKTDRVALRSGLIPPSIEQALSAAEKQAGQAALQKIVSMDSAANPLSSSSWLALSHADGSQLKRFAQRADDLLAYAQAAQLYERACSAETLPAEQATLQAKLARALQGCGQNGQAAHHYLLAAASAVTASPGTGDSAAAQLRMRALELLILDGQHDAAMQLVKQLLGPLGHTLPSSRPGAILVERARLAIRELRPASHRPHPDHENQLRLIDILHMLSRSTAAAEPYRSVSLRLQALRLNYDAGDPWRLCRALALEAWHVALFQGPEHPSYHVMLQQAYEASQLTTTRTLKPWLQLAESARAIFYGDWHQTRAHLETAMRFLRTYCDNQWWVLSQAQILTTVCLFFEGHLLEQQRRVHEYCSDAENRGDLRTAAALRSGLNNIAWLLRDDADGATEAIAYARQVWPTLPHSHITIQALLAEAQILLYRQCAEQALACANQAHERLRQQSARPMQMIQQATLWQAARCALASGHPSDQQAKLMGQVQHHIQALQAIRSPWAALLASYLDVCRQFATGAREPALFADLATTCHERRWLLFAYIADFRCGQLLGGEAGWQRCQTALSWLTTQGVKQPRRIIDLIAPCGEALST